MARIGLPSAGKVAKSRLPSTSTRLTKLPRISDTTSPSMGAYKNASMIQKVPQTKGLKGMLNQMY